MKIKLIQNKALLISGSLFIFIFILTRFPFFAYVNLPYIFDDAISYTKAAETIIDGMPNFSLRTPGYPLFLAILYSINHSILWVVYIQSFITLICSLFLIYTISKNYSKFTLPASLAISVFTSSVIFIHFESNILTESMYVNLITLFISFFIFSLKTTLKKYWFLLSLTFISIVYIRPSGLFLVPLLALLVVFSMKSRYPKIFYIYLLCPAILFYTLISSYNYYKYGNFSISTQAVSDGVCNTFTFIEKDKSFPDYINDAIDAAILSQTDKKEIDYINNTWDVKTIAILYLKYQSFDDKFWGELSKTHLFRSEKFLEDCKKIAFTSIKNHPRKYLKFVAIQYLHYFDSFHHDRTSAYLFFKSFQECFRVRITKYFRSENNLTGKFVIFDVPRITEAQAINMFDKLNDNGASKIVNIYSTIHHRLFRNYFWVVLYFLILIYSMSMLWKSRFQHIDAFIIFSLCLMNLFNIALISLVQIAEIRYNFTLHLIYYLTPALVPAILPWKGKTSYRSNT